MNIRASSLNRASQCPGCINASVGIERKSTAVSESGDIVHDAIAWYFRTEGATVPAAIDKLEEREKIIAAWFIQKAEIEINKFGGAKTFHVEESLSPNGEDTPDLVVETVMGAWLVFDWKTGYGKAIQAADSLQLAKYALLGSKRYGFAGCRCLLFSAGNQRGERFTAVEYNAEALQAVEREIERITKACENPKAKRIPGEHCQYCPAYMRMDRCKESCKTVAPVDALALRDDMLPTPDQIKQIISVYDAIQTVKRAEKPFMESLRAIMDKFGTKALGDKFAFDKPKVLRSIDAPDKAFQLAMEQGWVESATDFIDTVVKVPVSNLEALAKARMAETLGLKPKQAKEEFDKLVREAGVVTTENSTPSILRLNDE